MSEQDEFILYLSTNTSMGISSTTKICELLKDKDNKIKSFVEKYLKEYEHFDKEVKKLTKKYNVKMKKNKFMQKLMANSMMIEEINNDNSDSKIANILIRGFTMGEIDIEKRIKDFRKELNQTEKKDILDLSMEIHAFCRKSIKELKEFL